MEELSFFNVEFGVVELFGWLLDNKTSAFKPCNQVKG